MSKARTLRLLLLGVVATVSTFLVYPAVRLLGKRRPRFTYATGSLNAADYARLANKPGWAPVSTVVSEGILLKGLIRRPRAKRAPWVFFLPGNDANQLASGQDFLEQLRQRRDWGLFVTSYRGFDSSGGTPARDSLVADAARVYESLLEREKLTPSQVNILAFSLGGYLAVSVVGQAARANRVPATLSLLASVESIEMVRASWHQKLALGDVYETQPLLDSITTPCLVIFGTGDEALGVAQGRAIAKRLGSRAHYIEMPGVGHTELLASEPAMLEVRNWIEASVVGS